MMRRTVSLIRLDSTDSATEFDPRRPGRQCCGSPALVASPPGRPQLRARPTVVPRAPPKKTPRKNASCDPLSEKCPGATRCDAPQLGRRLRGKARPEEPWARLEFPTWEMRFVRSSRNSSLYGEHTRGGNRCMSLCAEPGWRRGLRQALTGRRAAWE